MLASNASINNVVMPPGPLALFHDLTIYNHNIITPPIGAYGRGFV